MADKTLSSIVGGGGGLASATSLPTFLYPASSPLSASVNTDPGSLTANTWKTVVSVTGKGVFSGAVVRNGDTTPRTSGVRVTIDGVVVATAELASAFGAATVGASVGLMAASTGGGAPCFAPYNTSLLIEVRASDTNTAVRYAANYSVT